ncbi:MAG TPA: PPOX class F420-dependent oxidoreductase [Thermomicrobiales bacterium]|nr:PPOX class F420-dependent oxidoreductase [Thermomicrobiales bacterium]
MSLTDAQRDFLNEPRFAVLATLNKHNKIQQTVMWYKLDGDVILMNTAKGRTKFANVEANPSVSVCIDDGYRFVTIQGTVTLETNPELNKSDIFTVGSRYSTQAELDEMYENGWKNQERISLRISIDHVITNGF